MDIVLSSIATDSMHFIHNALSKSLEFNKMQIDLDIALIDLFKDLTKFKVLHLYCAFSF